MTRCGYKPYHPALSTSSLLDGLPDLPTRDRHSRIWCMEAVLLCDRMEIGRGNVSTHIESPAPMTTTQSIAAYIHRVIHGDCIQVMRTMPEASVDLILTD